MADIPSRPAPPTALSDEGADWEAVARYLASESSDAEAEAVRAWLVAHPADAALLRVLGQAFPARSASDAGAEIDVERALASVRERMDVGHGREGASDRRDRHLSLPVRRRRMSRSGARAGAGDPRTPGSRWPVPALIAAAVVLFAALVVWRPRLSATGGGTGIAAREFVTHVGGRDSVVLGDGTRVVLGPDTRLVVAAGYGAARRDVELRGEAYFDVRHDAARPFAVHAHGVDIRDIGTTFAVHSDTAPGAEARVVVTSGAVQVHTARGEVNLAAGDVATLGPGGEIRSARGAATAEDLAWTRGQLVFRDASMGDVSADLRRWYGIELRVDDPAVARQHLTATFAGESVERVLDVIALTLGAEVERHGDTAIVRPAGSVRVR